MSVQAASSAQFIFLGFNMTTRHPSLLQHSEHGYMFCLQSHLQPLKVRRVSFVQPALEHAPRQSAQAIN
jgi:hypothetical protein